MVFRSFGFQLLFRVLLISAAFVTGFAALDAHAQTITPPAGQLTNTDGKTIFPFFHASKVGETCNPYVDYNCMASEATIKAAQDAAAKSGNCDPYLDYKCLDTYLGDDFFTRFFRYYQLEWGKAGPPSDPNAPPSARDAVDHPTRPATIANANATRRFDMR